MKMLLLRWTLSAVLICAVAECLNDHHVMLIGTDGTRFDAFSKVTASARKAGRYPHFLSLIDNGMLDYQLYAGGHSYDNTHQVTSSGPGWTTILTGVWANEHRVRDNNDQTALILFYKGPSVFTAVRKAYPDSDIISLADWGTLGLVIAHGGALNTSLIYISDTPKEYDHNDEIITNKSIEFLRTRNPKFIFVYLGVVDEAGHYYGFSPHSENYTAAIEATIRRMDRLMAEIENRRSQGERWLVALSTDHGGHDRSHGSQKYTDRQVFGIFQDPKDKRYSGGKVLDAVQGQTTFFPTIMDYLDVPPSTYPIFGRKIGQAPKTSLILKFSANLTLRTVSLHDGWPRVILPALKPILPAVSAVCSNFIESRMYFFLKNSTVVAFNFFKMRVKPETAHAISEKWPGLEKFASKFIACSRDFAHGKYLFFLSNGEYLSYDKGTHSIDPNYPKPITETWPKMTSQKCANLAAVAPSPDRKDLIFFLKTGEIVQDKEFAWNGLFPYRKNVIGAGSRGEDYYLILEPLPYNKSGKFSVNVLFFICSVVAFPWFRIFH